MNIRFRPLKVDTQQLKAIVDDFIHTQNYDIAIQRIFDGPWIPRHLKNKNKIATKRLQDHVSGLKSITNCFSGVSITLKMQLELLSIATAAATDIAIRKFIYIEYKQCIGKK